LIPKEVQAYLLRIVGISDAAIEVDVSVLHSNLVFYFNYLL
jgi:hypothetical protein